MEQQRLQAQLDSGHHRGRVQPQVPADGSRQDTPARRQGAARGDQPVHPDRDERQHDAHVDDVDPVGQHSAVTEQQGLERQCHRHRDQRRPRPQQHRDERTPDGMRSRPVRDRDVEHHHQEAHRGQDRQRRDLPALHGPADLAAADGQHRYRDGETHRTGRR